MKVLIAYEFTGIVRDAFIEQGHDAVSCDLLPSERKGPHIQDDTFRHLDEGWDMLLFFYPCTNMCVSGARWFHLKRAEQERDVANFRHLSEYPSIPYTGGENPIGVLSTKFRKPDQIIQPWQFGHGETKATCLWMKNLPLLHSTDIVPGRTARVHKASPGPDRWKERSRTLPGIARAMALQWGAVTTGRPL